MDNKSDLHQGQAKTQWSETQKLDLGGDFIKNEKKNLSLFL